MADTAPATNGGSLLEATKTNASAAFNSVTNGPIAENVKDNTVKASNELSNLANSRRTPSFPAATGQPLTHYHSFFSELLSWNNPRASSIAYVTVITLIFAARYLDVLRWGFKLAWMILGVTVAAEVAGKIVLQYGLTTQIRPRRYYTVPRETLDSLIGDVHELVNFFVIEAQRIIFAENIPASAAAFVAAFLSYFLVMLVPYWGLAVIGTTVVFFVPLIYISNQELIDEQIHNASKLINAQTNQVRDVASKQMTQVSTLAKQHAGDYTTKVQGLLRGRNHSSELIPKPVAKAEQAPPAYTVKEKEPVFPSPPTEEPIKAEPKAETAAAVENPVVPQEPAVPEEKPVLAS